MVSVAKRFANTPLSDQFHGHFEKPYAVVHHAELHLALLEACQQSGFVELCTQNEICNFDQITFGIGAKLGDGSQIEGTALIRRRRPKFSNLRGRDCGWTTARFGSYDLSVSYSS